MANSNQTWHLFFSYDWSKNNENQEKVRKIHDRIKGELFLKIWLDQNKLTVGNFVEQITEAIQNSKLFICFTTREYWMSHNCMREFAMAQNLNKPIIFFINEGTENMSHQQILSDIFRDASFNLGSESYQKTPEELIEAIKFKLRIQENQ